MKIYIIGPVGSGKTTLARRLSKELNINYYELDNVVWEYRKNGDRKRTSDEISKMFNDIIKQDNWIIEDVGRECFKDAYETSSKIIFLDMPLSILYKRLFLRWFRQKIGIEHVTYKSNFKMLKQMFKWAKNDVKESKLNNLKKFDNKLIILNNKDIKYYKIEREI